MKLSGDPEGINALKSLKERDPQYLKFLLKEATTNTDLKSYYKTPEGTKYEIKFNPKDFEFIIKKLP